MNITPLIDRETNIITSYNKEQVFINKIPYNKGILLSKDSIREHLVDKIENFAPNDVSEIIDEIITNNWQKEAILLIGYPNGECMHPELKKFFYSKKISFDTMTSDAAYRTYNVLISESRRVYAILF